MATERGLPTLIRQYLDALGEADRLEVDGLFDKAQEQRELAALLYASIDRGWSLAEIEAAYRQQMDAIFADYQSVHERCAARFVVHRGVRRAQS